MWFFNFQNLVRSCQHIDGTPCSTWYITFGPIVTGIRNNDDLQLNHDVISWMGASFSVGGLCGALSAGKTIFILQYFCFYFQLLSFKWNYSKEWSRRVFIFITLFSRSMLILCQHIIHCIHSTYLSSYPYKC